MTMYNWKEELDSFKIEDESLPVKELYAFRQYAAKAIAEKQKTDPAEVLEQLWDGDLCLWAIRTTSMLYQLLGSWYGDVRGMEEMVKNSFYYYADGMDMTKFFCFASRGSRNELDHDLLGGDYTTRCYVAFGNFVDRFMEALPDGPEYSNEIEDPDAEKRFNLKRIEKTVKTAEMAMREGYLSPLAAARLAPGVVAAKVWTLDDIREALRSEGYEGSEGEVNRVIDFSNTLSLLEDCTDQDWEIIHQAIEAAHIQKQSEGESND